MLLLLLEPTPPTAEVGVGGSSEVPLAPVLLVGTGFCEAVPVVLGDGAVGGSVLEAMGLGEVFVFADACTWLVTLATTVGVGSVCVSTTTLLVAGMGITDTVLVEGSTTGCAVCTEQKSISCAN